MLDPLEIQKRVRENFKNIMEEHAKHNLPVVIQEDNKIYHIYKDGRKVHIASILPNKE